MGFKRSQIPQNIQLKGGSFKACAKGAFTIILL